MVFASLDVPKHVRFEHPRILFAYYCLVAIVLGVIANNVWYGDRGFRHADVGQYIQVTMWADGHRNGTSLRNVAESNAREEFCQTPELYDYQWDEFGAWFYGNFSCLALCSGAPGQGRCLAPEETYLRETEDQLMIVTSFGESLIHRQGQSGSTPLTSQYFLPTTEALQMSFTYHFSIPRPDEQGPSLAGSSLVDILTVIMDKQGRVFRVVPPAKSIDLTFQDLLVLSGSPQLLDDDNVAASRNRLPEGQPFPNIRITGAELILEIHCHNWHKQSLGDAWDSWEGPVCYTTVDVGSTVWVGAERLFVLDESGHTLHRDYHGIRVKVQGGGFFRFLNFNDLFMTVVDAIVLLGMPMRVMLFFMCYMLGHLSTIYKRVLFEPFDIVDQVSGMSARLAATSTQFVELENTQLLDEGKPRGITRDRLVERLKETLQFENLTIDKRETDSFAHMCFNAILQRHNPKSSYVARKKHRFALLKSEVQHGLQSHNLTRSLRDDDALINLENFTVACSCNDPIAFDAVISLFDSDRRMSPLEWIFTPNHIKTCILETRTRRASAVHAKPPAATLGELSAVPVGVAAGEELEPGERGLQGTESLEERRRMTLQTRQIVAQLVQRDQERSQELASSIQEGESLKEQILSLSQIVNEVSARLAAAEAQAASSEKAMAVERANLDGRFADLTDEVYRRLGEVALQLSADPALEKALPALDGKLAGPSLPRPPFDWDSGAAKHVADSSLSLTASSSKGVGLFVESDRALEEACPSLFSRIENLERALIVNTKAPPVPPLSALGHMNPPEQAAVPWVPGSACGALPDPESAQRLWAEDSVLPEHHLEPRLSPTLSPTLSPQEEGFCTRSKGRSCIGFLSHK